ncbi:MAG: ATP-binding protein [Solobacterium sp.]|nr:ATP-binding protein [Solobacterium sp.]
MNIIERTEYLDKLIGCIGTPDIKVITGIRRSGKSILISQFSDYLKKSTKNLNLIYIDLQQLDYVDLLEYKSLHDFCVGKHKKNKTNVLIIDEVQLCDGFEKAINSLHSKRIYDIYLTGSNAFLLSSDLATLFTGRTIEVEVLPFSFSEYLQYFERNDIQEAFDDYFKIGGMPGSYEYHDERRRYDYITDVYRTIIERDLFQKYRIRNKRELMQVSDFMLDNISNLTSPHNICVELNKDYSQITEKTISKYISYLERSFVLYVANRYDLKGKKYLRSSKKYYVADHGIRYAVLGSRNLDYGRTYENIVYLELRRRGYDVYVGKLYQKEIDFVATKQSEKLYIQVSDDISQESTLKREYEPLLAIKDGYQKIIIARTRHPMYQYEGIKIFDIARWLAGND